MMTERICPSCETAFRGDTRNPAGEHACIMCGGRTPAELECLELRVELVTLRKQSAREHEAWEAIVQHGIQLTGGPRFSSLRRWLATMMMADRFVVETAADPVDAVMAVVEAAEKARG